MEEIKFKKIAVCLDMAGCPSRCKHCWIGHLPNGKLSKSDLIFTAKCFKKYTDTLEVYSGLGNPII